MTDRDGKLLTIESAFFKVPEDGGVHGHALVLRLTFQAYGRYFVNILVDGELKSEWPLFVNQTA